MWIWQAPLAIVLVVEVVVPLIECASLGVLPTHPYLHATHATCELERTHKKPQTHPEVDRQFGLAANTP